MAQPRLSMRKIREILRLRWECGRTYQEIADSLKTGRSSVGDCVNRAIAAGLVAWSQAEHLDDVALEQLLYPAQENSPRPIPLPDWNFIHTELKRKHVTKLLLWTEYKSAHPDGYQYTQFCERYRAWAGTVDLVFRNEYRAGERLFVDYAGDKIPLVDPETGKVRYASIFVAVLAASNMVYAEATEDESLENWIGSHVRAFEYFGGVPEVVTPDNLKSGVTKPCRYEPIINATYHEMARHYRTAVIPARKRHPKDKAAVENGVLLTGRWIIASLRNHKFFSLAQLNLAIRGRVEWLSLRPFKKLKGCRKELFDSMEKPALKPLPGGRYEFARLKLARVNIDYHVEVEGHYYSVPHNLVKREVEVRYNLATVEVFHANQRVASHLRSQAQGRYSTILEHRPPSHQAYVKWTPERMEEWAANAGENAGRLAKAIMRSRPHPELGYRAVLGLIRLGEKFGKERLDAACLKALEIGSPTYSSVKSILTKGLDRKTSAPARSESQVISHANIRGRGYFQ